MAEKKATKDMFVPIPGIKGDWALMPNKPTSRKAKRFELKCATTKHLWGCWSPVVRTAKQLDWVVKCPECFDKENAVPDAVSKIFGTK